MVYINTETVNQGAPQRSVQRWSVNMQQIQRSTTMQKCDFNKTTLQPYDHTLCIGTDVTIIKKIVILL